MENIINIQFTVSKKVDYGFALYVVGNHDFLGNWNISRSLRMVWTEGHIWQINALSNQKTLTQHIQFKYVIARWDNPLSGEIIWEAGDHNRIIELQPSKRFYESESRWNMQKIRLNLLIGKDQALEGTKYFAVGNCKELGNWSTPKLMTENKFHDSREKGQSQICEMRLDFEIYRGKSKIYYYYMKKNKEYTVQRHPGRKYYLGTKTKTHTRCLKISHPKGNTEIFEECNFNELVYSRVTERIFLGSYLKNSEDLLSLKKEGITCVLGIQTEQDFKLHSLNSVYLDYLCQKNSVEFRSYSIKDMNRKDFIQKCSGALDIMKQFLENPENIIYVHCSAGVYRSAQLVVLYLTLIENFSLKQAIKFVKQKHPVARPNFRIVEDAIQYIRVHGQKIPSRSF